MVRHSRFRSAHLLFAPAALALFVAACGDAGSGGSGGSTGGSGGSTGGSTTTTSSGGSTGGTTASGGSTGGTTASGGSTGSSGFKCSGDDPSWSAVVQPVVTCGQAETCHQVSLGNPNVNYGWLVNQPADGCMDGRLRVKPGEPENSYLVDKLTNTNLCKGSGMPKGINGYSPLPDNQIQAVVDWICQGAKQN
ncbi:MAG: hypothetical protein U0441_35690 [Polyangiaceae bacterium]